MTSLTNALNLAIATGTNYTPQSRGAASANRISTLNVGSSLLNVGSKSFSTVSSAILSAAYKPTFTAEEANTLANAVDATTLQAILQSTDYSVSTGLISGLTGTSLYDTTVSMLEGAYLSSYDTEA